MRRWPAFVLLTFAAASVALGQTSYPYYINTVAGIVGLGDGLPATSATLANPEAVAVDSAGNIYIGDTVNQYIRKVAAGSGIISTIPMGHDVAVYCMAADSAGNVYVGYDFRIGKLTPDGKMTNIAGTGATGYSPDNVPAATAAISDPTGIAVDRAGNLYFSDHGNHRLRKITPDGVLHTLAGTGTPEYNGDGRQAASAALNYPDGVVADAAGNVYVADNGNHRIRKIAPDGTISTFAGTGADSATGDGGPAALATFTKPYGLLLDAAGNLYVADSGRVRVIGRDGNIRTVAGNGDSAYMDPNGMAVDAAGNLYLADRENSRIRMMTPAGVLSTVAGNTRFYGDGGPAQSALFMLPEYVAFDGAGNMFVSDTFNYRVRKVDRAGTITTFAGTGQLNANTDAGPATEVNIGHPFGLVADPAGNLYIADSYNCRVYRVTPDSRLTTVAGNGLCGFTGDNQPATTIRLNAPEGLALDAAGNLYISETGGDRVRKVAPNGIATVYAGTSTGAYGPDGVLATQSAISSPRQLAIDKNGNLYIADYGNNRVRMVSPAGIIGTVVGNGDSASTVSGRPATATSLDTPKGVAVDNQGNLYVTSGSRRSVAKVDPSGVINTIATGGTWGYGGDGGPARSAPITSAHGLAVDAQGDVYFADYANHCVRKLFPNSPARLDISGGNYQVGAAGKAMAEALRVTVAGRAAPIAGVTVDFAVASGDATLSAARGATDANGLAGVLATMGKSAGKVTVTASAAGLAPAVFSLTAVSPDVAIPAGPRIAAGGVVGAGASVRPVKEISPNGIVTIYGDGFAPAGTARTVAAADLVNGRVPTTLAGVCVQIGGAMAPVLAVYPGQINVQVPNVPLDAQLFVQAIRNCGAADEVGSNAQSVTTRFAAPEFFYFARGASGSIVAATDAVTGAPAATAKPGDLLTLYGTGFGATNPAFAPGELPATIGRTVVPARVSIGNIDLAEADILYAGVTPLSPGLYQLNIRVPAEVPDGIQPVILRIGNFSTPQEGVLTVKR